MQRSDRTFLQVAQCIFMTDPHTRQRCAYKNAQVREHLSVIRAAVARKQVSARRMSEPALRIQDYSL